MRIAIVNDLPLAVEILRRTVSPSHDIAWIARDGAEAVEKCAADVPDVVLMDLIMPVMDGVQATRLIMRESPCPILVVTATVEGNASKVFEAMGAGALDAVGTPVMRPDGVIGGGDELLKKIATIGKLIGKNDAKHTVEQHNKKPHPSMQPPLIAIGCSTGGPKALVTILSTFPSRIGAAVVIVQHVDIQFATGLAEWLDSQTEFKVTVAREGEHPSKDTAYVAMTNDHLVIDENMAFHYTSHPKEYPYRPSVDAFFESLAERWTQPGVAALLTGIGRDGAQGLADLRKKGWYTIAQDMKTSVVYGMPKAAAELDAAAEVLPLDRIGESIINRINRKE